MRKQIGNLFLLIVNMLAFTMPAAFAQNIKKSPACSEKKGNYSINWRLVPDPGSLKLPAQSGNLKLPKKYQVFEVSATNLKSNLTGLRNNGGTILLPFIDMDKGMANMECLTFKVGNSGAMPKALNDKYPDIVSLKGVGTVNKANTVRFDYDGSLMNISVVVNGANYLYVPYKVKSKIYYLLFKKIDNNGSSSLTR